MGLDELNECKYIKYSLHSCQKGAFYEEMV